MDSKRPNLLSLHGRCIVQVDSENPNKGVVLDQGNYCEEEDGFISVCVLPWKEGCTVYFHGGIEFMVDGVKHVSLKHEELICIDVDSTGKSRIYATGSLNEQDSSLVADLLKDRRGL
jgi:hypothetical protein